jgi:hypothetical protein
VKRFMLALAAIALFLTTAADGNPGPIVCTILGCGASSTN